MGSAGEVRPCHPPPLALAKFPFGDAHSPLTTKTSGRAGVPGGNGAARSLRSCGDGPLTGRPALDGMASWALPVALRAVSLSRVYE